MAALAVTCGNLCPPLSLLDVLVSEVEFGNKYGLDSQNSVDAYSPLRPFTTLLSDDPPSFWGYQGIPLFNVVIEILLAGLDPSDINNAPFLWHKGEDFQKGNTAIPLMYRMATVADVKPANGKKFSRYLWKMPVKQVNSPWSLHHFLCLAFKPLHAWLLDRRQGLLLTL